MTDVPGEGGLRSALLPARLMQLLGIGRLASVHAIMDSLCGSSIEAGTGIPGRLGDAIAVHLPSFRDHLSAADLVDHQHQDIPLAILLLTHPALPRRASPLLLLRTLAGWKFSELASLYGTTAERVETKLNAGSRRMRTLGLGTTWPHFRDLNWRIMHSIEVIEQLHAVGRSRRGRRIAGNAVCECARGFLEALAGNPITRSSWVVERCWRIRYADTVPTARELAGPGTAMNRLPALTG